MDEEQFWESVNRSSKVACWTWMRGTSHGYGEAFIQGRGLVLAHRYAYEKAIGPIPENKCIDHLCRNKACINPAHLEIVTRGENVLRGVGLAAQNARKKNCPKCGGKYELWTSPSTGKSRRQCRHCVRKSDRDFYAKRKNLFA